ncbi:MAG: 4Fe-4S dicluster domain-containing protein [Candidatus Thorarchaeota archaeon]
MTILGPPYRPKWTRLINRIMPQGRFLHGGSSKASSCGFPDRRFILDWTASAPKTTAEAIVQGQGAAMRVLIPLVQRVRKAEGMVSVVDPELCVGCETCEINCAYNTIEVIPGDSNHGHPVSNAVPCQGCGQCAAGCPGGAITMHHFTDDQIVSQV